MHEGEFRSYSNTCLKNELSCRHFPNQIDAHSKFTIMHSILNVFCLFVCFFFHLEVTPFICSGECLETSTTESDIGRYDIGLISSWLDMSHHMIVISWFLTVVIADLSTVNCCTPLLLPCFLSIGIQPSGISNLCYLLIECGLSNFTNINFAAFTVNPLTHAFWFSQIRSFFQPYRSVSAA